MLAAKIKILYIVSTLQRSGPTNQLYNILKYLDRDQFDPAILTLSPEREDSKKKYFENIGIKIHSLSLSRLKGYIWGASELKELVASEKPDIIHTNGYRSDIFAATYLRGCKTLTTLRGNLVDNYSDTYGWWIGSVLARRQLRAIRKLDLVVTCSSTLTDMVRPRCDDVCTIRNAVDHDLYHPLPLKDRMNLRAKLGLPIDKRIFVYVGSLSARKDPLTMIKGFLGSKISRYSLLVVLGTGPLGKLCRVLAENHKNIVLLGKIDRVADYLKISDFFISASLSEGLPNAVIEALACGLPVCLSDIPQHREIVDGCNVGEFFTIQEINDVSLKLDKLSECDYNSMRQIALYIAHQYFDAEKMSEEYQKAYFRLLEGCREISSRF